MIKRLIGLALAAGAVVVGYWIWQDVGWTLNQITRQPFRDFAESYGVTIETLRATRTVLTDLRLVLQILAAFLLVSVLDWLWRKIAGA